ncbi:hypothetical protein [Nocardia terpenica]|uniref:Nuclear transport factor 2 family protein n=1 Tax=Nocardia terpenica TaxID=455432 RepID=A0A164LSN5_9NOCA|nr:hypothetical protein [Nocardia terpenica]KZM72709.1 hypothetical protein AWN90_28420 [Nocardia terpenica]NQE92386.1 hypothetical protein [Nocardia terpenica]
MTEQFDLPAVLTELLYGTEDAEPLETTLDRLLAPDFVQRINGQVFQRQEFAPHVREMRKLAAGGGELQVLEQISTPAAVAGRYLFHMVAANGTALRFESHLFASVRDGTVARFVEVARQIENTDNDNFLTTTNAQ